MVTGLGAYPGAPCRGFGSKWFGGGRMRVAQKLNAKPSLVYASPDKATTANLS